MTKAYKGKQTSISGVNYLKEFDIKEVSIEPTVAQLSKKIKGYDNMSQYERQKALAEHSVSRTLKRLVTNCKSKAVRDDKEFSITHKDLMDLWEKQGGLCYYSKQPMELSTGTHKNPNHNRVSVDRYDNTKGYVKGNLRLCKWIANQAKGSASSRVMIKFCNDVASGGRTR
jgi:hypothetical protein